MTHTARSVIAAMILLVSASLSTSFSVDLRNGLQRGSLYRSSATSLSGKHEAMRSIREKRMIDKVIEEQKQAAAAPKLEQEEEVKLPKKIVEDDIPSNLNGDSSPISAGEECSIVDVDLGSLEDLEPLERQLIRLEGLEPYVLVSVLTATASYETITETAVTTTDGTIDWIAAALLSSCMMSTLSGVYTTVVFSLCILYGKTALGMDREPMYFYFLEKTAQKRFRGFQTFAFSLLFFCVDILLLGIDKSPAPVQWPAAVLAAGLVGFGFSEWGDITDAAQPIFTNVIPSEDEGDKK